MADIFISYTSKDREFVSKLATLLEASGWSVWWDRKIITGQTFDQVIEHELEIAKSIIVIWSKSSITSEWVKNEASVAAEHGLLVPVLIDHVQIPLEFRRKQTADLVDWDGSSSHEGLQMVQAGITVLTNKVGAKTLQRDSTPTLLQSIVSSHRLHLTIIVFMAVFLGFITYKLFNIQSSTKKISDIEISSQQTETKTKNIPSSDIDNPNWLHINKIEGYGVGEPVSHYYTFIAGPGIVKVTADAKNGFNGVADALGVVLMDMDAKKLLDFHMGNTTIDKRIVERVRIPKRQQVLLRLLLDEVTIDYMVRIEGDVEIGL
ncbi:MAG: toll/interleukin-1 receptor domain-containing protein [Deltaproteobacteria bacterium]|nr:toll/interleukin-1 receptor domain-containing protein [Deltaproteobacteria bacterium]